MSEQDGADKLPAERQPPEELTLNSETLMDLETPQPDSHEVKGGQRVVTIVHTLDLLRCE